MKTNIMAYKGIKTVLIAVAGLVFLQSLAIIFQAKWLSEVITALFHHHSLSSQIPAIMYFVMAFLFRQLMSLVIRKVCLRFSTKTVKELREALMETIFSLGPRFTKKEGTGNLVTFIIEGCQKLRVYLELFIPKMVTMGITPWLIAIYIWTKDYLSAVILLAAMPILIIFMILLGWAAQKKIDDQWSSYRLLSNHFVDSLRGLETLKYLGRSKSHIETVNKVSDQYRKSTMSTLRIAFLSTFALDFFTMLSVAVIAVTLGLRLINGSLLLQPALLILLLAPEYFLPVREVGNDYHATLDGKEAGDRILALLKNKKEEILDKPESIWSSKSTLTVKRLSVLHDNNGEASLKDVSFTVEGAKKIGIIGTSGAGKSTLIDVLSGFLSPSSGSVNIDNEHVFLHEGAWQKQTTYIPQHPFIFQGTVKENICFYRPEASDEEVMWAIEQAGLKDFVHQLPRGMDERIGEGGRPLSGGQAQRIAVSRAFLSNRPVLLFDEPTAHLDIETEYELKKVLLKLAENRLLFFATHRLHWMKEMDRIIVLEQGRIVEQGSHDELIAHKGAYYRLIQSQMEELV
ncbi:thiol reductant ABC exporter subunit CydD [Heyndrickxia acidicola]|uniref:Thiol reductant ABC exporter subunit CydD n=1 Tax=Heyndrickxia acidicola TaxID=209389 RepID=A0ABU6MG67_9BACI|nr:thiol reductant ABC exporter subunit CydD [Heyndrickxia acidicola]MED1203666.1 thiol reductant ABC exporter subunit CydD [Heyndrickxia acidicola]